MQTEQNLPYPLPSDQNPNLSSGASPSPAQRDEGESKDPENDWRRYSCVREFSRERLDAVSQCDAPSGSFDSAPVTNEASKLLRRCAQDDRIWVVLKLIDLRPVSPS
jgi:hypothetical protein